MSFWEELDSVISTSKPSIQGEKQENIFAPFELSTFESGWLKGLIDENGEPSSFVKYYKGSLNNNMVTSILFKLDREYNSMETILLIDCSTNEVEVITSYYNDDRWSAILLNR